MKKQLFLKLIERYQQNQATEAEKVLVEEYLKNLEEDNSLHLTVEEEALLQQTIKRNIDHALHIGVPKRGWLASITRYAAAAILLLMAGYGLLTIYNYKTKENPNVTAAKVITAGSNKAVLTLANGSRIELNDAVEGTLAKQGNVTIQKTKNGQLIYHIGGVGVEETGNNMISTPRGGQYQVILPDHSKVWLNAASSITFPPAFKGNTRKVSITGEAYFEVAHDARKPFSVTTGQGITVEVLGTHFNVNAYDDEPVVSATLLSGSVLVKTTSASKTITPGEQAQIATNQNSKINVNKVNTANVVAWKDDLFIFEKEDIQTAMRRISRWYNVDVVYINGIPKKTIGGTIGKFEDVSEPLRLIELTGGVKFKIEGRRILVMK